MLLAAQLSDSVRRQAMYSFDDMVGFCMFNNIPCGRFLCQFRLNLRHNFRANFSLFIDPIYGACYQFNMPNQSNFYTFRPGKNSGLRLLLRAMASFILHFKPKSLAFSKPTQWPVLNCTCQPQWVPGCGLPRKWTMWRRLWMTRDWVLGLVERRWSPWRMYEVSDITLANYIQLIIKNFIWFDNYSDQNQLVKRTLWEMPKWQWKGRLELLC